MGKGKMARGTEQTVIGGEKNKVKIKALSSLKEPRV